ncbi:hypothetical protein M1601_04510 [Mycoplasma capricolum subsp. capripneumoniae M1601]|nr:hypothetical protein M1601_04510 [Mycoplasma capricolum subsp. capripneumoniae M1601]
MFKISDLKSLILNSNFSNSSFLEAISLLTASTFFCFSFISISFKELVFSNSIDSFFKLASWLFNSEIIFLLLEISVSRTIFFFSCWAKKSFNSLFQFCIFWLFKSSSSIFNLFKLSLFSFNKLLVVWTCCCLSDNWFLISFCFSIVVKISWSVLLISSANLFFLSLKLWILFSNSLFIFLSFSISEVSNLWSLLYFFKIDKVVSNFKYFNLAFFKLYSIASNSFLVKFCLVSKSSFYFIKSLAFLFNFSDKLLSFVNSIKTL